MAGMMRDLYGQLAHINGAMIEKQDKRRGMPASNANAIATVAPNDCRRRYRPAKKRPTAIWMRIGSRETIIGTCHCSRPS